MAASSPSSSDVVEIKWYTGVSRPPRDRAARVVFVSNPEPESWFKKLMSRNPNSLANRIRRGEVVSAWDGIDDPFGPDSISPQEDHARREAAREEANRRQDELNARLAAERHERALDELQDLEGYGSF